jgi:hypothetical protein
MENPGVQSEMHQFMKLKPPLACLSHEDFREPNKQKQITSYKEIQIKTAEM